MSSFGRCVPCLLKSLVFNYPDELGLAYSTVFGGKPPKQTDLWGGLAYSLGRAFVSAPPSQSFSLGRKVTLMLSMCIFRTPKIIINQAPQRGRSRD
ncbi:hypothetical protein F0578_18545 [Vibrio parahaemolyticus]|nr:hypothetical protein FORC4_p048 [Vibrio parahaemolyticus]AZU96037.1 hypothetical protein D0871_26835 [Vibrio parahaemolyticus]KAB5597999.1 hypothetical protein F0578_18545 [Vibrio parahaemolyticus]NKJ89624.1 hypothetical protein [Vibrio parahaemolyticus]QEL43614.1 hypothetical protein BSR23_026570 [Vibrio parahaemolyticus]